MAIKVEDRPDPELLACPEPARAFPTDQAATIPKPVRDTLRALLIDYRSLYNLHARLVEWHAPDSCPGLE